METGDFGSRRQTMGGVERGERPPPRAPACRRIEGRLYVVDAEGRDEHEDEKTPAGLEGEDLALVLGVEIGDGREPGRGDAQETAGQVTPIDEPARHGEVHTVVVTGGKIEVEDEAPGRGSKLGPRRSQKRRDGRACALHVKHRPGPLESGPAEEDSVDGRPKRPGVGPGSDARSQGAREERVEIGVTPWIGGIGVRELRSDAADVETDEQALPGGEGPREERAEKARSRARRPETGEDPLRPAAGGRGRRRAHGRIVAVFRGGACARRAL